MGQGQNRTEQMTENKMLTTTQAAQRADRHSRTIVGWIRTGKLPAARLPGKRGQYLIDPDVLDEKLREWNTPQPYVPTRK